MDDYPRRVAENILPLSRAGSLPAAFREWYFSGSTIDHEAAQETCQLCDQQGLRYHFEIGNEHNGNRLDVGSECILKFQLTAVNAGRRLDPDETKQLLAERMRQMRLESCLRALEHYATALLEKLAHFNGVLSGNEHYIRITIPPGISYEEFQPAAHSGWDGIDDSISKAFGAKWHLERRSCLLIVPSIPAGRIERNFLINLRHPDASKLTHDMATPVPWDARLFQI